MVAHPPGAGVSEFIAFAILDELIRTLVDAGRLTRSDAAGIIERVLDRVRGSTIGPVDKAVRVLKEMLDEYRKQTG